MAMGNVYDGFPSVSNEEPRVRGATKLNTAVADASTMLNVAPQNSSVVVVAQTVAVTSVPPGVYVTDDAPAHVEPATTLRDTAACEFPASPKPSARSTGGMHLRIFMVRFFAQGF